MKYKQLGIIGQNYEYTTTIFETIINETNANCDQENIVINLIYSKSNDLKKILDNCKYLKNIGCNKILITKDMTYNDIKFLSDLAQIEIIDINTNINDLVEYFKDDKDYE